MYIDTLMYVYAFARFDAIDQVTGALLGGCAANEQNLVSFVDLHRPVCVRQALVRGHACRFTAARNVSSIF